MAAAAGQADSAKWSLQYAQQQQQMQMQHQQQEFQRQQADREYQLQIERFKMDRDRHQQETELRRAAQQEAANWHKSQDAFKYTNLDATNERATNQIASKEKVAGWQDELKRYGLDMKDDQFAQTIGLRRDQLEETVRHHDILAQQGDQKILNADAYHNARLSQIDQTIKDRASHSQAVLQEAARYHQQQYQIVQERSQVAAQSHAHQTEKQKLLNRLKEISNEMQYQGVDQKAKAEERRQVYERLGTLEGEQASNFIGSEPDARVNTPAAAPVPQAVDLPASLNPALRDTLTNGRGRVLDPATGRIFMQLAKGDPNLVRAWAQKYGWKIQ